MNSITMETRKKQSLGKRKIEIKKIEKKSSRQVTFSKRRSGLFRKAGELCILCGAEAAIFVVSPAGKVFTFAHPNVERIINHYEGIHELSGEGSKFDHAKVHKHVEKLKVLEAERNRLMEMNKQEINGIGKKGFWWNTEFRGMGLEEILKFKEALEELKNNVNKKAEEKAAMAVTSTMMLEYPMNDAVAPPPDFDFTFFNYS